MSSEVSQCRAFATKTWNRLADCPLAESETISEAKVSLATLIIVDTLWAICIETPSTLACELKLDSLGLGLVLLLMVLIVDPHFPFLSSRSSPHPVPSEQLWPQSPEHPAGFSGKMTNPRTETRMRILEPKSAQPKQTRFSSMPYRTMSCYRYHPPLRSKGQVQNHDHFVSGCFVSSNMYNFGSVSCHFQFHGTFKLSWSLSHYLAMSFYSYHLLILLCDNTIVTDIFVRVSGSARIFEGFFIFFQPLYNHPHPRSLTDSLIRIVNLSGDSQPHNVTHGLLAIYWQKDLNHHIPLRTGNFE